MVTLLKPQRRSLHATITPAFALSLALIGIVCSLAYQSSSRLVAIHQRVEQAQDVVSHLASATAHFERVEAVFPQVQLHHDPGAIERLTASMAQASEDLRLARSGTVDCPDPQMTLADLEPKVAGHFEKLRNRLREASATDSGPVPIDDQIKSIRDLLEQARAEEASVVRDRAQHAADLAKGRIWPFVWIAGAVFLGTALSYVLVLEYEAHCRRNEKELKLATRSAESANQFKSTFLASMSHEIREPLTAILGYSELLMRPSMTDEDRARHTDTIRRNGAHLLQLVNDILDLSKIEAGKMEVEKIQCYPIHIVDDVITLLGQRASEKGVTLEVAYEGPCPESIQSDPIRLRQILTNLIGNAIKFSAGKSVRLTVHLPPTTQGINKLQFRVTDNGVGMTPEQLASLFQAFKQGDAATLRKYGGTGLGLTIAKQFAALLGGDITVTSEVGAGSTFSLEVATGPILRLIEDPKRHPKQVAAEHAVAATASVRLDGRVLLVEDGITNQQLISLYLTEAGAEVSVADNGKIACDLVASAAKAGTPFHLILMDMEMPEMDGCEAARHIRNTGFKSPIIALTANAMSQDRDLCMASGCNAFMSKPIDWPRLIDLCAGYLRRKTVAGSNPDDPHLLRVRATFMKELETIEVDLVAAIDKSDRDKISKIAHALGGTAGNCGYTRLSQLASDLAQSTRGTATLDVVMNQAQSLVDAIYRARAPKAA